MAQKDREALVALYNATDGPDWDQNTNWGSGAPLKDWFGVKTNDQDRVVELSLYRNNLRGSIPPELGKLAALQSLILWDNELTGTIPRELRNLRDLKELSLGDNQFTALWDTLGQEEAGSTPTEPGTIPAILDGLLDFLARIVDNWKDLEQNPWEHPPEPIVAGGVPAVRKYFEAVYTGRTTAVSRPLKVVIVGKETVGKTSLRRSIKSGKPSKTREGGVESTVHVDVEDHKIDDHPIRIFDCAGQVVYYGLLQLFLTPRAVYLLVWDAENASNMVWDDENASFNLESLSIAPWLRNLTFRVPDANVVLVGNKWDLVGSGDKVDSEVERQSHDWLASWTKKAHRHQPNGLSLENGVSLVSCARQADMGTGWPCDWSEKGLFRRITHNPADRTRAVTMRLPESYRLALEELEELAASCRRKVAPGITRERLEEKWQAKVGELKAAGQPVAAPEAAMSGAILIRKWEGGLVEYGSFVFLDVQWFATVLDPLFSHKRDKFGDLYLGDRPVTNAESLRRLEKENVLEPQLAEDLWGPELAKDLLFALQSAGLMFPLPKDPGGGLVILLRMDAEPPDEFRTKLREVGQADQDGKHDLVLHVKCSFSLGLPPGFVERLLARCCYLGLPYPFWRHGALIVGEDDEEGRFSLSLEYSEQSNTLTVKVYGGHGEVYVWGALSKVLSVLIKMLAEFPGLPCEPIFFCPLHEKKGMWIRTKNARPGSPLVDEHSFCKLCAEKKAATGLLAVALQVVEFSDDKFFDSELCQQFAELRQQFETTENVAWWPGSNMETSSTSPTGPGGEHVQIMHVLGEIKGDVGEIKGGLGEVKGGVGEIKEDVGEIKGDVGEMKGDLSEIKAGVGRIERGIQESLMCLRNLQGALYPYPHLAVVKEVTTEGKRGCLTRARDIFTKDMTLHFLCPVDMSEVPCGIDGKGYRFRETRGWVKKLSPVLQVAVVTAKVALRATVGLDVDMSGFLDAVNGGKFNGLDVGTSEFLNALIKEGKEGIGDYIAERILDEEALSRVVSGKEVASADLQTDTTESYEVLKMFMEKEVKRRKNAKDVRYIDFKDEMEPWTDGKGGMVWVRKKNVPKWRESHPNSAPCR
eukprot:g6358.t1